MQIRRMYAIILFTFTIYNSLVSIALQISSCTGFAVIAHANTKFNRGYATIGVGLALCAQHGFILPNGVGDLQKGERYVMSV